MTALEMVFSIWLFLHRLKSKVRALSENEFNRMLYDDGLTYEQKIYLIYLDTFREREAKKMAKFGINDILNAKTKAAGQQAQTEGYKEIYLSPYEVKAAQENTHQRLENIEELADSFLHVGQEQPTVLARVNGEYRIIDGHRRNAANILNLERGHKEYEKVLYRFMDMSEAMYELRLLAGNGYTQELTAYEKPD